MNHDAERRRHVWAVIASACAAALVALPVSAIALGVASEASGCFITCDEPDPGTAVVLAIVGLALLAIPAVVGTAIWRSSWRTAVIGLSCIAVTGVIAQVLHQI